jgi:TatD DNase family protein
LLRSLALARNDITTIVNLTDTHCHLDLEQFDSDRAEVLSRAGAAGVRRILIPALDLPSSRAVVELAAPTPPGGAYPVLFAAVGVHPTQALEWDAETRAELKTLALGAASVADFGYEGGMQRPGISATQAEDSSLAGVAQNDRLRRVVAIGEIGLDYYWDAAPHEVQQAVLREQLELAAELLLPVVIHLREKDDAQHGACAEELLRILGEWAEGLKGKGSPLAEGPGVLHSFSGDLATARRALDLGFCIGVTGPITYKNAEDKRGIIRQLPLERLLIETDAPYLAPVPQRGKRNEPAFVRHIADRIAEVHHTAPEKVAEATYSNAARLFGWG